MLTLNRSSVQGRWLVPFLMVFLLALDASAQSKPPADFGSLSWFATNTRTVLRNARKKIEPVLTKNELSIAKSIDYRVNETAGIGAFATIEDGKRVIAISAGFSSVLQQIADAMIFDQELGLKGCFADYSKYLADQIIKNTARVKSGLNASKTYALMEYAVHVGKSCNGLDPTRFTSRDDLGVLRARMIEASIVFLYLHELGHHVLGHPATASADLATRRAQEDKADRWAIATALKARFLVLAAQPFIQYMALLGGDSIESENWMTHPLGVRRFLRLLEDTHDHFEANPADWTGAGSVDEVLDDLKAQISQMKSVIASLK